ncbi:hypothetical protein ACRE1S_07745 [Helicobacter himalayensis]
MKVIKCKYLYTAKNQGNSGKQLNPNQQNRKVDYNLALKLKRL